MRTSPILLTLLLGVSAGLAASQPALSPAGSSSAGAPPQHPEQKFLEQLIGNWDVDYAIYDDHGHVRHYVGAVTYRWILAGAALQEIWTSDDGHGAEPYATTIEFFDPKRKSWTGVWIYPEQGMYYSVTGSEIDGRIVLTGDDQHGVLQRWSTGDMHGNSFDGRYDISKDGGKTWQLVGINHMHRHRAVVSAAPQTAPACCRVLELRQYFLKPGGRDALIRVFDREFIETQEAVGMHVVGEFRDDDDPDRFVWLRGFADMPTRKQGLSAFYTGPAWKKFGKAAAATMIDSDDVLLLRPVDPPGGFDDLPSNRPPVGADAPPGFVIATIYHLRQGARAAFPGFFRTVLRPALRIAGVVPRATFQTEQASNNYPELPIREGEDVFVWFASYETPLAYAQALDRLARSPDWSQAQSRLGAYLDAPPHELRLRPTARSLLH